MDKTLKRRRTVQISMMDDDEKIPQNSGIIGTNQLITKRKIDNDTNKCKITDSKEENHEIPIKKLKFAEQDTSQNHDTSQETTNSSEVKNTDANSELIIEVMEGTQTKKVIIADKKSINNYGINWTKYFVSENTSFIPNSKMKKKQSLPLDEPSTSTFDNSTQNDDITTENQQVIDDSSNVTIINNDTRREKNKPKIPMPRKKKTHVKKEAKNVPNYTIVEKFKNDEENQIQIKIETAEPSKVNKCKNNSNKTLVNFIEEQKLTYRVMKRVNLILKMVKQDKIIVDLTKLVKFIREEEALEGHTITIDKKSILRLILKLSEYGLLKYRKATLKSDTVEKNVTFVCDNNVDDEHSVINSVLEQSKLKYFVMSKQEREQETSTIEKIENVTSIEEKNTLYKSDYSELIKSDSSLIYKYNRLIARKYGYRPKYGRCRILHELIFYIVYEKPTCEPISDLHEQDSIFQEYGGAFQVFENSTPSPVYTRDVSWKMFIPPHNAHEHWPEGWIILSDILLRLPLNIFMQCFNICYEIPQLEEYLAHPIRKYFLIKNLPPVIRNGLIYAKKLTATLMENLKNLCYLGLLRLGPQKMKERDQMFIYINRRTTLYNTVTTPPGYIRISDTIEYGKIDYMFNNIQDVEQYWYDMWSICVNTPLGYRSSVEGEYVVIESCWTKPELINSIKPHTAQEAVLCDTGDIPGDRRGAAGLDSALFSHLKRNWNHINAMPCSTEPVTNKIKKEKKSPKRIIDIEKELEKEPIGKKEKTPKTKPVKFKVKPLHSKEKIRHIKPKLSSKKKVEYDEKDKLCLKRLRKLRTDWSELEDHCLLLTTIAQTYLCSNFRKQHVEQVVFRDVLHKMVPYSNDKTSRAVHRRIVYILKNPKTRKSMLMFLEEIKHCEYVTDKFGSLLKMYQNTIIPEKLLKIAFIELVAFLNLKFNKQIPKHTNHKPKNIPNTVQELKDKYDMILHNHKRTPGKFKDVESVYEIECDTVRSVIHSSLCSTKDKTSWAFQLFKIYQQYPEQLLRHVITKIRIDKMASMKKHGLLKLRATTTSSILQSPFKLSVNYTNQLLTKITFKSLSEANLFIQNFMQWIHAYKDDSSFDITYSDHGTSLIIENALRMLNLEVHFEHPDQVIILDPVIAKDKTYERILNKYYDILKAQNGINIDETKINTDSDDENLNVDLDQQLLNTEIKNPSRIGFHMMRADMFDCNEKNNIQHMHDYFVVQASKMYIKPTNVKETIAFEKEAKKLTCKVIQDIKKDVIVPDFYTKINSEDIKSHFSNLNITPHDIEYIEKIKCHIHNAKEFGLVYNELKSITPDSPNINLTLKDVLNILQTFHIILRVGITCFRFVHHDFKKPWLTHADKILRLEKEKMSKDLIPSKWKGKKMLKGDDHKKDRKLKIIVAPWIRLDGSLNRRVLDRWLATIVSLTVELAGVRLKEIFTKVEYLKPTEIMYLIEQLIKINSVRLLKVKKPEITLFSDIEDIDVEDADILDDPKDILVEPTEDAFFNYSVFVGAKTYSSNFVD